MQLLHMFWSTEKEIGEYFKDTWVIVNPNETIPLISDITNEENEQGDSDNGMIEVQLCDVGILKKPFLMRKWHINNCAAQVEHYFISRK